MFDFWANSLSSSHTHFQDFFFLNAFQLVLICLPAVSAWLFLTQHFAGSLLRKGTVVAKAVDTWPHTSLRV